MLDLIKAYLHLNVTKILWKYQTIKYKDNFSYLTRLGFGLFSTPRIMLAVVGYVLSLDKIIVNVTDHNIDDIAVNTNTIAVDVVISNL